MTGNFHFEVPNNGIGRTFIKLFRQFLNRKKYTMLVRGRASDRIKVFEEAGYNPNYMRDVPLPLAERLVIYLNNKKVKR